MSRPLSDEALDAMFREARTHNAWLDKLVDELAKGKAMAKVLRG